MASGTNSDKPNSVLTDKQRTVLRNGGKGLTDQARWKMNSRIRKRLAAAISDFGLIWDHREEIRPGESFEFEEGGLREFEGGILKAFAVFYKGLFAGNVPFEPLLERGIFEAELDMNNRPVNVTVTVERDDSPAASLGIAARKVEENEFDQLRIGEMRALIQALANSEMDISEAAEEGGFATFGYEIEDGVPKKAKDAEE